MGGGHSLPRRGGVARQLNRSWRAGVARSASPIGRSLNRSSAKRCAGLTTPSAPLRSLRDILLMAQPPLLCEEGNASWINADSSLRRPCMVMHILYGDGRDHTVCRPARVPRYLFLAAGRAGGSTDPVSSSVARERRAGSNRTIEALISSRLRVRRLRHCGYRLVSPGKALQRTSTAIHLQNIDRAGLLRTPD